MSREDVRKDIESLRTERDGAPVPLEELLRDFRWFKPLPRARGGGSLSAPARKEAVTRLLKALYAKVQTAVLAGDLTVAPQQPTSFNIAEVIRHHKGALPALRRRKGQKKDASQEPKLQGGPWINYSIVLDEKFIKFVGGDEGGGGLSASYGGSKATPGTQSRKKSNWAQLRDGVKTLRAIDTSEVKSFVALFDHLDGTRKKTGRRPQTDEANPS